MKVIVIGCGKLGSSLALELTRRGNDVTVVENMEHGCLLLHSVVRLPRHCSGSYEGQRPRVTFGSARKRKLLTLAQ